MAEILILRFKYIDWEAWFQSEGLNYFPHTVQSLCKDLRGIICGSTVSCHQYANDYLLYITLDDLEIL